jgi:hypothetical protein
MVDVNTKSNWEVEEAIHALALRGKMKAMDACELARCKYRPQLAVSVLPYSQASSSLSLA